VVTGDQDLGVAERKRNQDHAHMSVVKDLGRFINKINLRYEWRTNGVKQSSLSGENVEKKS
jgi:hypothetical protein